MTTSTRITCLAVVLAMSCPATASATEDAALLKDLTAVILLLGLPCDQVVRATRRADNDHVAVCSDGHRYRVFVNAEGRVVAEKL